MVSWEASCALSGLHSQTVIGLWCAMDRPSMSVRMIGEELAREAGRRETTAGPAAAAAAAKADAAETAERAIQGIEVASG